ncbi:unnamed protein product [Trifolium pratense]|uniref:Uncharacterized protein n=1 Tax=Trifolium pratense TaxID=57577 RepID=A0ACB0KPV4_TRIPR|nr:unnamed protein product [Trifolium pratense]
MRSSCNGCRALRRGCSENCIIKPCLEWIRCPETQGRVTLFLAKFYGRTGLLNLLANATNKNSIAVFKSLLYEASGRLANPTHGALGLLLTGEWSRCEAAVEAVLTGSNINVVTVVDGQTSPCTRIVLKSDLENGNMKTAEASSVIETEPNGIAETHS